MASDLYGIGEVVLYTPKANTKNVGTQSHEAAVIAVRESRITIQLPDRSHRTVTPDRLERFS